MIVLRSALALVLAVALADKLASTDPDPLRRVAECRSSVSAAAPAS